MNHDGPRIVRDFGLITSAGKFRIHPLNLLIEILRNDDKRLDLTGCKTLGQFSLQLIVLFPQAADFIRPLFAISLHQGCS